MVTNGNEKQDTKKRKGTPKPPDGGWGWLVVAASFIIHIIADGVAYTFGLFFVYIAEDFHESKSATSWITSIMVGMTYGSGPIAGAVINKLGCRTTAIIGSFVAAFGFAISYFAQSVTFLYFSIGIVGGLGIGLIFLPAIVCVTTYFDKRRSFATGIAVCGSGFGTTILAPIIEILIRRFEWRCALVITGGIIFSCFIFSCFFKPLKDEEDEEEEETQKPSSHPDILEPVDRVSSYPQSTVEPLEKQFISTQYLQPVKTHTETLNTPCSQPVLRKLIRNIDPLQSLDPTWKCNPIPNTTFDNGIDQNQNSGGAILDKDCHRKDIFLPIASDPPSYPVKSLPEIGTSNNNGSCRSLDDINKMKGLDGDRIKKGCGWIPRLADIKTSFHTILSDFTIIKDPVFLFFAFSTFLAGIGYIVPYIYLVDLAIGDDRENPVHSIVDASFLLSIVGFTNTISRVVLGYLSDKSWMNRLYLYSGALIVCGLATVTAPHVLMDLNALRVCSGVFGATVGVYLSLTSVILVDLFGLEKFANAFGLLLFFEGLATVIGPPIVGGLSDHFNSHMYGFGLAGGMIVISGLMLFLIPLLQKKPINGCENETEAGVPEKQAATCENKSTLCVQIDETNANQCINRVCKGVVKE